MPLSFSTNYLLISGADELLPVLSFVITQSKVPNLSSELAFIEEFMHKSLRFELQGCLLTHLQVAMQFLKTCNIAENDTENATSTEKVKEGGPVEEGGGGGAPSKKKEKEKGNNKKGGSDTHP